MLKKRNADISITLIVAVVIGLIILVVLIAMIGGKLGSFSEGASKSHTCENACKALGQRDITDDRTRSCNSGENYLPGNYDDLKSNKICCCIP